MAKILIAAGKIISQISRFLNLGNGSTWPGHVALALNKHFVRELKTKNLKLKTILIAGTNGKTTTGKLIQTILETAGKRVFQNEAGANLLNGVASSLLLHSNIDSTIPYDYAVFEIDENSLPLVLNELTPNYLILLNLFRDQLDRYGEVNTIAQKWKKAIKQLNNETILVLNADDPQIASLGNSKTFYFGLNDPSLGQKTHQHAADSTYCPNCGSKLIYKTTYFSHLGDWQCPNCGLKRPGLKRPGLTGVSHLSGVYNRYNTLAAVLTCTTIGINQKIIDSALQNFSPAFGRQEIIEIDGKKVQIFLSKNPTSFNQSLRTISELKAQNILLVLNDRIPDGRDVSWIWDIDTEDLIRKNINIIINGDRAYDMGLRLKYSSSYEFLISNFQFSIKILNFKFQIEADLKKAITLGIEQTPKSETLYILPTYSAMLEVRKILTGKKIL